MLSIRPILTEDIDYIADYWMQADADYLRGMGADIAKLFTREAFTAMLSQQIATPITNKQSYATIWLVDGLPIGHCNVNGIVYGDHAYMHLHIWKPTHRTMGIGTQLIRLSVQHFFNQLDLQVLYCEPYALNPAPNRTLSRAGFTFVKCYTTTPGSINFEQEVNLWEIKREFFLPLFNQLLA